MDDLGHVTVEAVPPVQWTGLATTFADCTYEQVYEYCSATAANIRGSTKFFRVLCDNTMIGAAAVRLKTVPLLGRGIAYVSAGPLTRERSIDVSWDQRRLRIVLKALKQELVDRQGHVLRVRLPLLPPLPVLDFVALFTDLEFRSTDRARKYRTSVIDLTQEIETLRNTLNSKWRTDLRFAQKAGLSIDSGTTDELQLRFERLFDQMHRTKGIFRQCASQAPFWSWGRMHGPGGHDRAKGWDGCGRSRFQQARGQRNLSVWRCQRSWAADQGCLPSELVRYPARETARGSLVRSRWHRSGYQSRRLSIQKQDGRAGNVSGWAL